MKIVYGIIYVFLAVLAIYMWWSVGWVQGAWKESLPYLAAELVFIDHAREAFDGKR